MERWSVIPDFPDYSVSSLGRVRNDATGRVMALNVNQRGIVIVGMMRGDRQHKRSVPLLVAHAFLPSPPSDAFDTPINLDGDRHNNEAENLAWRPRWFAIKYAQQFHRGDTGIETPIMEIKTRERFDNSWQAATKYGLLDKEIQVATFNRTYVWPTYQEFRSIFRE